MGEPLRFTADGPLGYHATVTPGLTETHSVTITYRAGEFATVTVHNYDGTSRRYEIDQASIDVTAWPAVLDIDDEQAVERRLALEGS